MDLVIRGGRVMDPETGFDSVCNVGIANGRIVEISEEAIHADSEIDVPGCIVAPGFIDTHSHTSVTSHGGKLSLRNGVTTAMDFETGAINIAEWYSEREGAWQLNFGTTVSQGYARGVVLDGVDPESVRDMRDWAEFVESSGRDGDSSWSTAIASVDELNRILELLDRGLMEGALGIGSLLGYLAGGVTTREMYETQKVGGAYGRLTAVHHRILSPLPPTENSIGAAEVLWNGFVLDAPVVLCHFNVDNWPLVQEMLVKARDHGMNAWGEVYPYTSGSTFISADFFEPESWKRNFGPFEETVMNTRTGEYLTEAEVVRLRIEDPGLPVVCFMRPEEWVVPWLKMPGIVLAGDTMLAVNADGKELAWDDPYESGAFHPRTAGTQGKALRLARENDVDWMQMLSIASYNSAKHLGDTGVDAMKVRGRLQEGMVADITVFEPDTVQEASGYAVGTNGLPTTGIPYVIVNGVVVVRDSKVLKDVNPGQPIRYNVESEGRFEPIPPTGDHVLKKDFPH